MILLSRVLLMLFLIWLTVTVVFFIIRLHIASYAEAAIAGAGGAARLTRHRPDGTRSAAGGERALPATPRGSGAR